MKKIIAFIFALALALSINVDTKAAENATVKEFNNSTMKEKINKVKKSKKISKDKIGIRAFDNGEFYLSITATTPNQQYSGSDSNYFRFVDDYIDWEGDPYTAISYYKIIAGKNVNYKNEIVYNFDDGKDIYTALYLYDTTDSATCKPTEVKYGCLSKYSGYPVIKTEIYDSYNATGKKYEYEKIDYSIKKPGSYIVLFSDYRYYHSNGNIAGKDLYYGNESDKVVKEIYYMYDTKGKIEEKGLVKYNSKENITFIDYRTYYTNGKTKNKMFLYNDANENLKNGVIYSYNSKGKMTAKIRINKNGYRVYHEVRKYYKNNKVKEKIVLTYNGKANSLTKSGKYTKYCSNGTKQVYKKQIYNSKGNISKMYTYTYNKKGQKKSNKYGNSYKYTTYFKANTKKIKKVTKAKYNNEGKLKKLSEVKSTSFTKKYYYIK